VNACPAQPPDGNLPAARRRLEHAISALTEPKPVQTEQGIQWLDSLYDQLVEAIPGTKLERSGVPTSQPPVWIDAMELLHEIDTAITAWEPRWPIEPHDPIDDPTPPTILRLRAIQRRKWRPQDVRSMEQIAGAVESWAKAIQELLSDKPRWHVAAPCPACERRFIYQRDNAGELTRRPALQITPAGCACQNPQCRAEWIGPQQVIMLARTLQCDIPRDVLE
jgi:hypothetical protein